MRMTAAEYREHQAKRAKVRKYLNQVVTVDGRRFDSISEAKRYGTLKLLQMAGEIRNLQCQPVYDLFAIGGVKVGSYRGDFSYDVCSTGEHVIEDVKGKRTASLQLFKLKRKLLAAQGFHVRVIIDGKEE